MLTRGVDAECWRVRHRGQVKGRGSVVPGAEGREAPGGSGSRARERAWPAYAGRSVARQSAGSQQLCFPPPAAARRASRCYWPAQRFSGWGGGAGSARWRESRRAGGGGESGTGYLRLHGCSRGGVPGREGAGDHYPEFQSGQDLPHWGKGAGLAFASGRGWWN